VPTQQQLRELQESLQYTFLNQQLLRQACTHPSYGAPRVKHVQLHVRCAGRCCQWAAVSFCTVCSSHTFLKSSACPISLTS